MNLVEQIFAQANAASAQGESFYPAFAQGVQQAQHQQQINAELAVLPLKQTLLQQEAALSAAKTEGMLYDRQTVVQTQQQLAGLAGIVSKALTEATPEDASPYFFDAIQKTPRIAENPYFQKLWQDVQTSSNAKMQLEQLKQENKAFTPRAVTIPSATPGEPPYTAIQTGPNSYTLPQSTVTSMTTPEGVTFEQRTGAGGAPASAASNAANTQLTEKLNSISRSSALLDESIGLISPQNIGPQGKLNRAIETGRNIIAPGSAPTPVTRAQTTFNTTAQAQYNALKADSQINKMEAAAMSKIADVTDWWEAAATAREKYQTLRDLTGLQAILTSHKLNRIAPDDILKGISLDAINKYLKEGTATAAEVQRWVDLHGGADAVKRMILDAQQ